MKLTVRKLKIWTASLFMVFSIGATLAPAQALALGDASKSEVCDSIGAANCSSGGTSIGSIMRVVINVISVVVGFVAVVMIIVGGFRYVTSGGESSKIAAAKNTIIYAMIGLVIVALSQFLVQFVLHTATNTAVNNAAVPAKPVVPVKGSKPV